MDFTILNRLILAQFIFHQIQVPTFKDKNSTFDRVC